MRMHSEGLWRCQLQSFDLLAYIPETNSTVACILGTTRWAFVDTLRARLLETFVLGDRMNRLDMLLDIPGNELAVATHAALQVHKVVGVADGADARATCLALVSEALVFMTGRCDGLRHLLKDCGLLWGTT